MLRNPWPPARLLPVPARLLASSARGSPRANAAASRPWQGGAWSPARTCTRSAATRSPPPVRCAPGGGREGVGVRSLLQSPDCVVLLSARCLAPAARAPSARRRAWRRAEPAGRVRGRRGEAARRRRGGGSWEGGWRECVRLVWTEESGWGGGVAVVGVGCMWKLWERGIRAPRRHLQPEGGQRVVFEVRGVQRLHEHLQREGRRDRDAEEKPPPKLALDDRVRRVWARGVGISVYLVEQVELDGDTWRASRGPRRAEAGRRSRSAACGHASAVLSASSRREGRCGGRRLAGGTHTPTWHTATALSA